MVHAALHAYKTKESAFSPTSGAHHAGYFNGGGFCTFNHLVLAALKAFRKVQGSGERGLKDREGMARKELDLYKSAGEKGMRDLARRKELLEREMERMEGEIGRVERGALLN
ncbi:MAG: hypothetical protein EOP88_27005 [Verrucomicrobiaceae bacterium]|nr:MAG: hypothetical protein EOP88_27005 [Verrucomicrobiaceae bacterium]